MESVVDALKSIYHHVLARIEIITKSISYNISYNKNDFIQATDARVQFLYYFYYYIDVIMSFSINQYN